MEKLKKALLFADENFLISLSNKGTYKRACKDIEQETPDFDLNEDSATVRTGGETCTICVPLAESKCTCVSRGICRHIVGAIITLRNNIEITEEPPKKANEKVSDGLKKELSIADENFLISLSNKGTYKRACKDIEQETPDFDLNEDSATVRTGGETCTICVPLAESKCTCVSRGICRHIVGAIITLRNNIEITEEPPKKANEKVSDGLKKELSIADENFLISLSNKGTYKRACKDIEQETPDFDLNEDSATVRTGGETCTICVPLAESKCTCVSRGICRHIVGAIITLRNNIEITEEPPKKANEKVSDGLKKELSIADENFLISLSNKGTYKRACKDIEQETPDFDLNEDSATVRIGGETCTICVPLAESKCTCVSRGICRHIVGAIITLRNNINIENIEIPKIPENVQTSPVEIISEEPPKENLSQREIIKIHNCVKQCLETLSNIIKYGLVRIPESLPDMLEASAVRCHALKMADAERTLRETGNRLSECIERCASFNMEGFINEICYCTGLLNKLTDDDLTSEQLGTFKQTYIKYNKKLTILPIGQRSLKGDYVGEIYYFLNVDPYADQRFLSLSDVRPAFYDNNQKYFRGNSFVWGMDIPIKNMMHSEMVLINAKVSNGKLSTSQETTVLTSYEAKIDCDEVRDLIYTDFRKLAIEISEKNPESELDKLCFVQPEKCIENIFDKYTQHQVFTLEDIHGNRISVRAKYSASNKDFIDLLDNIGRKMLDNPKKNYVFLATAYIYDGELTLFPIEVYDFIKKKYDEPYELPDKYSNIQVSAVYAEKILDFFTEVTDSISVIVRSGLQTDIKNNHKLENMAFNYGLKGLSSLICDFMESASSYRHSMNDDCTEVLMKMHLVLNYIQQGRKRLAVITSLSNMKGNN